jgi:(p)ppGpp synthase/HD superfamily hydrolase
MPNLKIHNAIIYAVKMHEQQKRKGTDIPYIVHPMEVMQILTENQCSEEVIIAGILHDTFEDTVATPYDIEEKFGKNVLAIVAAETEDKSKTWKERKQATIEHLRESEIETQLVCCADKLSNICSIYTDRLEVGDSVFDRFSAPSIVDALEKIDGYKMKQEVVEPLKFEYKGQGTGSIR